MKLDVSLHMAPVRRVRRAQAGNLDGSNVFLRGTSPKRHHAKWFARAGTSLNGLSGLDRDQGFLRRFDGMLQEYGARSDKGFDLAGKRLQGFTLALERWQAALLTKLVCPGLAGRFKLMGKLLSLCHKGQEAACAIKHIRCRGAKGKQATLSFGLFYFPHVDQSLVQLAHIGRQ